LDSRLIQSILRRAIPRKEEMAVVNGIKCQSCVKKHH